MIKSIEFQPLVEGRKVPQIQKLMKSSSFHASSVKSLNSSFITDSRKKFPTCLPVARRLSIKSNLIAKPASEKKFLKSKTCCFQAFEDSPNLPKRTYHNDRIYWRKRISGHLPLLIVNFEGVVGDYFKQSFWTEEKATFSFRENAFSCLKQLQKEFYVAIVSTYSRTITNELLRIFEKNRNNIDAIYIKRHRKWNKRYIHNISSILDDFKINDMSKVIAISAIGTELNDIKTRKGFELIYEQSASYNKKFLCYFAPTCEKDLPITILVPHLRLIPKVSYFNEISHFIIKLKRIDTNFFNVFEKYSASEKIKVSLLENTEDNSNNNRPLHKFIFFSYTNQVLQPSSSEYLIKIRKQSLKFINFINK